MQRWSHTDHVASGAQIQAVQAGGTEAGKGGEVDVREEVGLRRAGLRRGSFKAPALGRKVGPAREQIRRQVRRKGERLAIRVQRGLDLQRGVRPQSEKRGKLVSIELDRRLGG